MLKLGYFLLFTFVVLLFLFQIMTHLICEGQILLSVLDIFFLYSIVLETDSNVIASKVASHSIDAGAPLSEQVYQFLFFSHAFPLPPFSITYLFH